VKLGRIRWEGHIVRVGGLRNAYKILVGKPERKGLGVVDGKIIMVEVNVMLSLYSPILEWILGEQ
jgi:hypothetical protein